MCVEALLYEIRSHLKIVQSLVELQVLVYHLILVPIQFWYVADLHVDAIGKLNLSHLCRLGIEHFHFAMYFYLTTIFFPFLKLHSQTKSWDLVKADEQREAILRLCLVSGKDCCRLSDRYRYLNCLIEGFSKNAAKNVFCDVKIQHAIYNKHCYSVLVTVLLTPLVCHK